MLQNTRQKRVSRVSRVRTGNRIQVACVNCKERKLKCDDQAPACANCQRHGLTCLVEDPATKRRQPRNYLEALEERVMQLEGLLRVEPPSSPVSRVATLSSRGNNGELGSSHREHNRDDPKGLASKAGLLALNAAGGEPHYLGASSAFAFSQVVHSSLGQSAPESITRVSQPEGDDIDIPFPRLLPDFNIGITLSNAYFQNIHLQYPFLHEPTFRVWERQLLVPEQTSTFSNFDPVPLFFVNMVYAVGALLLPDSGPLAEGLYSSARHYMDYVLSLDNLDAIQGLLCCAMFSLRSPAGPSIWKLSGLAVRQCIELGYHRSNSRFQRMSSTFQLQMQKRAFWCAYGIDCAAAIKLGRPLCLSLHEVDAEFPMDIDDSKLTETGVLGSARSTSTDPLSTMTIALHVFRLRCLWARIHSSLYSDINVADHHLTSESCINSFRESLDNWLASAPPTMGRASDALSIFARKEWFELNYHYTILFLYRDMITLKTPDERAFNECLASAANICHEYRRQYIGKPVNYTWGAVYTLFLAGLTYLHCLWTSAATREAVKLSDFSSTCTDCTIVLVVMAERWQGAAPYRDIFETLANRTMAALSERTNRDTKPVSETPDDYSCSGDTFQRMVDVTDANLPEGIDRFFMDFIGDAISETQGP